MGLISRIVSAPREVARLRVRVADLHRQLADERCEKERERHAARHDALTGLPNRLCLTEQAGAYLATPQPAVAMIDLDGFKPVNDAYGHDVGDGVLAEVATRLRARLCRRWLVARLAGDEFAAIREGPADERQLLAEARAAAEAVAAPMVVDRHRLRVTCSIGLVIAYAPADLPVLLRRADAALYRSKGLGGTPVLWHPRRDDDTADPAGVRPAVRTRDLRRARFGGMSVLVAADHAAAAAAGGAAVGRARPVAAGTR
jgi:diguanylate cyclase (GGDEF)-like protein